MRKFPALKEGGVAVLMADGATGHILNHEYEIYIGSPKDEVYWCFDNLATATAFIKIRSELDKNVEFLVYDENEKIVQFVKATYWNQ